VTATKGVVLDANILIRAVLGTRVRSLLERYEDAVEFYSLDSCFNEARQHLPAILERRGLNPEPALHVLDKLGQAGTAYRAITVQTLGNGNPEPDGWS
jgi:nucleotidyltransferase/DNA polymerase involved in DNA repair